MSEQQPLPVKYRPRIGTTHPMAMPVPALVGITDTNVSAHVAGELVRHLTDVAKGHPGLELREAERVLWGGIMPLVPVVDLAVGDYLHPCIHASAEPTRACPRG